MGNYGDQMVLALTSNGGTTSNCGWYGCRVAYMADDRTMKFSHGGANPGGFYVRGKAGEGRNGCVNYGDQIVLALTSNGGTTSNCGWYGCRVAYMTADRTMKFSHGGANPTGFYVRGKAGEGRSGCVNYGDQIVLALTSNGGTTSNCGWYGCRVAYMAD